MRKEKKERDRARKANAEKVLPISRSGIVFNINYADKDCTYYQRKGFCMFNFLSQQKHGCNLCRFRHEKSDVKILSNAEIKAHMAEEARLNPQEFNNTRAKMTSLMDSIKRQQTRPVASISDTLGFTGAAKPASAVDIDIEGVSVSDDGQLVMSVENLREIVAAGRHTAPGDFTTKMTPMEAAELASQCDDSKSEGGGGGGGGGGPGGKMKLSASIYSILDNSCINCVNADAPDGADRGFIFNLGNSNSAKVLATKAALGEHEITVLWDTCACDTLVSDRIYKKFIQGQPHEINYEKFDFDFLASSPGFRSATGGAMIKMGETTFDLEILPNKLLSIKAQVLARLVADVIIGHPTMRNLEAIIDYSKREICLTKVGVSLPFDFIHKDELAGQS